MFVHTCMQDIKSGVIIDDTNQELFRMLSYPKLYDSRKHHPGSLLETNRHPQVRWGTKKPKNLQTSTLDAWITYIEEFWLHWTWKLYMFWTFKLTQYTTEPNVESVHVSVNRFPSTHGERYYCFISYNLEKLDDWVYLVWYRECKLRRLHRKKCHVSLVAGAFWEVVELAGAAAAAAAPNNCCCKYGIRI